MRGIAHFDRYCEYLPNQYPRLVLPNTRYDRHHICDMLYSNCFSNVPINFTGKHKVTGM